AKDTEVKGDPNQSETDETNNCDQQKLLRLLGGQKNKNAAAATRWVSKSLTKDEGKKLTEGLEQQYNNSLSHKLSGKARRHVGLGFGQDEESATSTNKDRTRRSRSRSPIRSRDNEPSQSSETNHEKTCSAQKSITSIDKKKFYMQFKKSES
uniref:Small acidic protein n=1 Tax=Ciona savignyi TaxID=51511 RepID=H2Z0D5_CIOSA